MSCINFTSAADDEIKIFKHDLGLYTQHFAGNHQQSIESFLVKDETSLIPLTPILCDDGIYELFPSQLLEEKGEEEIGQARDFEIVSEPSLIPFRYIGNLLITFPRSVTYPGEKGLFVGTGFLISPKHVLTAGHNIYNHKRGGWAEDIIFTPAQDGKNKPFGSAKAKIESLRTLTKWIEGRGQAVEHDIGIITLDRPIGEEAGWAGLLSITEFEKRFSQLLKSTIFDPTIAGYPMNKDMHNNKVCRSKNGAYMAEAIMLSNKRNAKTITKVEGALIHYTISTLDGNSGSPIMVRVNYSDEKSMDGYYIIGLHTLGGNSNQGVNITPEYLQKIINEEVNRRTLSPPTGIDVPLDIYKGLVFVSPSYSHTKPSTPNLNTRRGNTGIVPSVTQSILSVPPNIIGDSTGITSPAKQAITSSPHPATIQGSISIASPVPQLTSHHYSNPLSNRGTWCNWVFRVPNILSNPRYLIPAAATTIMVLYYLRTRCNWPR